MDASIDILTASEMREKYIPWESKEPYTNLDAHFQSWIKKGVTLNPKIFASTFHLKNGLPITGFATKEEIKGGEVLFRIPFDLIFSSDKARLEPELSQILKDQFFKGGQQNGEMRILTVFSLFLIYKKDETNLWYQMASQFPKQCDIVCFWPEAELKEFKDPTVRQGAKGSLVEFEHEWTQFEVLRKKHQLLQNKEFDKQNYEMMFLSAVNRAFYSILKFVSHGPVAEFINHQSAKVYYGIQKEKETYLIDEKENLSETSSLGSCECIEVFEEGQFDYLADQSQQKQLSENQNLEQNGIISSTIKEIVEALTDELDWKDFTVIFVGKIMDYINSLEQQFLNGKKTFEKVMEELAFAKTTVEDYKVKVRQYYQVIKLKEYLKKQEPKFKHQKFASMILKTTKFDHFKPNNQVYLRYGPNCNRTLLLTYGLTIQGNKYDHYTTSFKIIDYLKNCPEVFKQIAQKKLSLFRKFNIYNHRVNIDLLVFFRLCQWAPTSPIQGIFTVSDLSGQIAILQQILGLFKEQLAAFDGQYDLTDKSLSYHQYFITIYNQQKALLLKKQIRLFTLLIEILNRVSKGSSLEEAAAKLTKSQRVVLGPYLSTIKI